MKSNIQKKAAIGPYLLPAAATAILLFCVLFPKECAKACTEGILLWAGAVLPSLFPFLILSALLVKTGAAQKFSRRRTPLMRKVKLPSAASYCFVLSALSGYPVGSRMIADLYESGTISSKQAARMSVLCSTSGPMFLIGSVGAMMFHSVSAGVILLAAHLLSVLLICLCFLPFIKQLPEHVSRLNHQNENNVLAESVQSSVLSILCVGGFIAFFSVIAQLLQTIGAFTVLEKGFTFLLAPFGAESAASGLAQGLLEATRGCAKIAAQPNAFSLPICAFLTTFGGACILAQQLGYLKKAGVKATFFVCMKALQGLTAFFLCLGLCALIQ